MMPTMPAKVRSVTNDIGSAATASSLPVQPTNGERQHPQPFLRHLAVGRQQIVLRLVQRNHLPFGSLDVGAAVDDDVRAALDQLDELLLTVERRCGGTSP